MVSAYAIAICYIIFVAHFAFCLDNIQHDNTNPFFKAAIVITIADKQKLHPYFLLTCKSIENANKYFDLIVFHEGNSALQELAKPVERGSISLSPSSSCAKNVKFIDLSANGIVIRVINAIVSNNVSTDKIKDNNVISDKTKSMLIDYLSKVIRHIPKYLVEIKPMLGEIMADYLSSYSHWTYSDPDILWGKIDDWIEIESEMGAAADSINAFSEEEKMRKNQLVDINQYDVITISKNMDSARLFLRGEFSLHKNNARMNYLWREIDFFSLKKFVSRIGDAVSDIQSNKVVH